MKRKIISMLLTSVMLLALLPAAFAAGSAEVSFTSDKTKVKRGETVTFTVNVNDAGAVRGFQAGLCYNSEKFFIEDLDFLGTTAADAFTSYIDDKDDMAGISLSFSEPYELDGDIAYIVFRAKEDAASGDAGFAVSEGGAVITDGANENISVSTSADAVSVAYDYTARISAVPSSQTVFGEDELSYIFSISQLDGMRGLETVITYDTDILELTGAQAVGCLADGVLWQTRVDTEVPGKVGVAAEYASPASISGEVLKLDFKVVDKAVSGECVPVGVESFRTVDASGGFADLYTSYELEPITVSRSSYIEMSYIPDRTEARSGEEVTYTVTLDRIARSRGFQAQLIFDSSRLEFVSAQKGEIMNAADRVSGIKESDGKINMVCAYEEETEECGVVAVITFKVKAGAADGYAVMSAAEPLAVDGSYNYVDSEGISNFEPLYIGRLAKEYSISLSADKGIYSIGDTLYLTADMGEVSDFLGVQFDITFDANKLEYIAPQRPSEYYGPLMRNAVGKTVNSAKAALGKLQVLAAFGNSSPYSGSGEVCTIAFKVKEGASGAANIAVGGIVPASDDSISANGCTAYLDGSGQLIGTIAAIGAIGDVTLQSKSAIDNARRMYDALSAEEKQLVSNYAVLAAAEARYYELLPVYDYSVQMNEDNAVISITNNKSTDEPVFIVKQYDESGKAVAVNIKTLTLEAGESEQLLYPLKNECVGIKCFLWESMASMIPYGSKTPIYEYYAQKSGGDVIVRVKNNSGTDEPALIVAQYDENGVCTAADIKTLTMGAGMSEELTYPLRQNSASFKCFLWENAASMIPYRNQE
ncbi:MAG: cohesin domain-containing protein [Clostridiales bacterium]|nr:cohesin domain-containing protein [Clostridiales bacterium]